MPPPPLFWQISETYLNPQIMSTTLLLAPHRIFKPSYGPEAHYIDLSPLDFKIFRQA